MTATGILRRGEAGASSSFAARRAEAARRRLLTAVAGVALVAVIVAGLGLIYATFSGDFTHEVTIRATIPPGQPVEVGNEVEYLQVPVGTVSSVGAPGPGGMVVVTLHLTPSKAGAVPANVVAQVAPSSLFGSEAILLSAAHPEATPVHAGQLLSAASAGSSSLQGTLQDLNNVLTGLHPAEIDSTLGALATALQGQGPAVRQFVDRADAYLEGMLPDLPTLESDISLLTPVLDGLSGSIPALLDLAGNASTTADTITSDQQDLVGLLTGSAGVSSVATTLLSDIQTALHGFLVNSYPFLVDVNADPSELPKILDSVANWGARWSQAESSGPWVNIDVASFSIDNPTDLILAGTGALGPAESAALAHQAIASDLDPATYTAADCPRYGSQAGPNCPTGPAAASVGTTGGAAPASSAGEAAATGAAATGEGSSAVGSSAPATAASVGAASLGGSTNGELSPGEQAATVSLATSLAGGRAPTSPATATLLLDPLLRSLVP
jgi:phospholipid/cholesterol/gamma-HCH transport system substrate-binding protein